jgi:hypothetical protein
LIAAIGGQTISVRSVTRSLVLFLCLTPFALASPCFGQSTPASVRGLVHQSGSRPVTEAIVTVTSEGLRYRTSTNARGAFALLGVEPATYRVDVAAPGMSGARRDGVVVPPGSALQVRVELVPSNSEVVTHPPIVIRYEDATTRLALRPPLLDHVPLPRLDAIESIAEAFPGIANGSALGAGAHTSTTRRVDGIDLSDPLDGSVWTSHIATTAALFDARLAGAPAAEGGFAGAAIEAVTRSGANRYSSLIDVRVSTEGLVGDNLSEGLLERNALLADADRALDSSDVSAWIGGPVRRNRTFFGLALGHARDRDDPEGPRTERRTSSLRVHGRLSTETGAADRLAVSTFFEHRSASGLAPDDVARVVSDEVANTLSGGTGAVRMVWYHALASRFHLRAAYSFLSGSRDLEPSALVPARIDGATGEYSGSQGIIQNADRQRHLMGASVVTPYDAAGAHLLESGVELEATRIDESMHFVDGTLLVEFGRVPNLELAWDGSSREGRTRRLSLYGQDLWTLGSRMTISGGVRLDVLRGSTPDLGTVYEALAVAPRLGISFDLTGSAATIARVHYGTSAEPLLFSHYDRATSGVAPLITYAVLPNGSRQEIERHVTPVYAVDGSIRHPYVREFSAGLEQRLAGPLEHALVAGLTFVSRGFEDFVDGVFPDARWIPLSRPGLDNGTVRVYRWANRAASEANALIQNVDGVEYLATNGTVLGSAVAERQYRGVLVDARVDDSKGRWNLWAAYAFGQTEGTVDNDFASSIGRSARFASPSASLVNVDGRAAFTPAHEMTVLGTARVPGTGARISAVYAARSGRRYAAIRQFGNETIDFPQSEDGRQVLLEPRGTRALEADRVLDLRAEYEHAVVGTHRVTAYVDVMNLFDRATVLEVSPLYPVAAPGGRGIVPFDAPTRVRPPRRLFIGARWTF